MSWQPSSSRFRERAAVPNMADMRMLEVIEGNAEDFAALPPEILPADPRLRLTARCREELARRRELLEERRRAGRVRRCHGDLHLGNIVLLEGPSGAVRLSRIRRSTGIDRHAVRSRLPAHGPAAPGLPAFAQRLLNGYLDGTWDDAGLACCRCFCLPRRGSRQGAGLRRPDASPSAVVSEAREYLERALAYLTARQLGRDRRCFGHRQVDACLAAGARYRSGARRGDPAQRCSAQADVRDRARARLPPEAYQKEISD